MTKTLLGIFQDRVDVNRVIERFKSEGFNPQDISIVMKDVHQAEELHDDTGASVTEGAVTGVTSGAIIGGVAGLLASIAIPGLGAFLIGGPIATAFGLTGVAAATVSGVATGAVAGVLVGALTGLGLSEEEARSYEVQINEGAILVAVPTTESRLNLAFSIFEENNAIDIKTISQRLDDVDVRLQSHRDDDTRESFTYIGMKGGKGWHGDPKKHSRAAKKK